jgi:hypothetical protein
VASSIDWPNLFLSCASWLAELALAVTPPPNLSHANAYAPATDPRPPPAKCSSSRMLPRSRRNSLLLRSPRTIERHVDDLLDPPRPLLMIAIRSLM